MPANGYSILFKKENAHNDPIYSCDWVQCSTSGDSAIAGKEIIATGGLDGLVKVWTLQNYRLELLNTLEGHAMGVVSVVISPSASTIVSISLDSHLILWDLSNGKKITEIPIGESDVWKVAFSPNGKQIVTGGHTGKIYVHDVEDGAIDTMFDTRGKFIMSVDWSQNSEFIATGSGDGKVCILDTQQRKVFHTIEAHTDSIRSIMFSPCSRLVATASNDGFVKIYGVISAGLQGKLEHKSWVVSVCFTPDGNRIATGSADGTVRIADVDNLKVLYTFEEHKDTACLYMTDRHSPLFKSVCLTANNVARRVHDIAEHISYPLSDKNGYLEWFSLALDESTDLLDTAQVLIFIREVDKSFEVYDNLLIWILFTVLQLRADIFKRVENAINNKKPSLENLKCNTTDGDNMCGKNKGIIALVLKAVEYDCGSKH